MAGDSGTSFPVAGLAVVALFLSTAFLGPRGFDLLRQSENDGSKQVQLSQPAVEARLWEDPFDALRRHLERLKEICPDNAGGSGTQLGFGGGFTLKVVSSAPPAADARCRDGQADTPDTFKKKIDIDQGGVTVIAAMLPGGAFVGSEESRRRNRYAVLAGLNVAGYVPDNSERMGLLRMPRCESFSDCPSEDAAAPAEDRKAPGNVMASGNNAVPAPAPTPAPSGETAKPAASPTMDMVYETLRARVSGAGDDAAKRRRVVVVWIDDSLFGPRWLSKLAIMLRRLSPPGDDVQLRILGPADTEGLVDALDRDFTDLKAEAGQLGKQKLDAMAGHDAKAGAAADGSIKAFRDNWKVLTQLRLISPNSTAPDERLLAAAHQSANAPPPDRGKDEDCSRQVQSVEQTFRQRLDEVRAAFKKALSESKLPNTAAVAELAAPEARTPFFVRTIGTDDLLIDRLVTELFGRGLDVQAAGASRRVALIGEWDSIYARTFAESLRARLSCEGRKKGVTISLSSYQYLRGLDGVTVEGAPTQSGRGDGLHANATAQTPSSARSGDRAAPPVEWPEGRDQRDYLRRLVDQRLGQNDWRHADTEVQALGIIGNDVHDKLMILQALRDAFQDRVVFTTDLDARLLHPVVNPYTRNLIVASSLPLALGDDLQCGIAPFRDTYQTAMFLGARYAATADDNKGQAASDCPALNAADLQGRIGEEIAHPLLFEIARNGAVELAAASGVSQPAAASGVVQPADTGTAVRSAAARGATETRVTYAVLAGVVWALLGVVMVLGKPGPAMEAARRSWSGLDALGAAAVSTRLPAGATVLPAACSRRATIVVGMLQAAALGFAAGVVVELAVPGSVGPHRTLLLAALAAAFFWAFVHPGTRWLQAVRGGDTNKAAGVLLQLLIFAGAVFVLWRLCAMPKIPGGDLHEPFAALNGASAWPSQLLRTLAIVLFAWFLDFAWCRSAQEADLIGARYFPATAGTPSAPASVPSSGRVQRALNACRDATIWLWQPDVAVADAPGAIDGPRLWREYRRGLLGWPRLRRIALWLVLSCALLVLVSGLVGGAQPEIPARGIADRTLFQDTLFISAAMLLFLMVVVADVTVLTWRFIVLLKSGRTIYPDDTVQAFAAELGTDLKPEAAQRIAALAVDRGAGSGRNTLLDDWIDARLLGDHTAVVGPLIFFPFILLALMIIARSHLFDNWQLDTNLLIMFAGFVVWSLAMAALLNYGAELARRRAVERMEADLLWLNGAGAAYKPLAEQYPGLIKQVRELRQGAFAPFFQQPLVQAMLVPLGGAGGVQLLDYLLLARSP
jgi:hypothetical protein